MKITVFDHANTILLNELNAYNLPITVMKTDLRDLVARQNVIGGASYWVSPANSFGFMNGGIDAVYMELWPEVEKKVRESIELRYDHGELLVGQSCVVVLDMNNVLIAAPTMRTPSPIRDASAIYLATRSAVNLAKSLADRYESEDRTHHLFIPGMGTGVGRVHPILAARNMALGIKHGLEGAPKFETCAQSSVQHEVLRTI